MKIHKTGFGVSQLDEKYAAQLVRLYFACKKAGFSESALGPLNHLIAGLPVLELKIDIGEGRHCVIDKADFWLVKAFNWTVFKTADGDLFANDGRLLMHDLVFGNGTRFPGKVSVSHKNGDGLDNRRKNLWSPPSWPSQAAPRALSKNAWERTPR